MIRLHDGLASGNGYKARLLLAQLGIPFERIEYDIDRSETRTSWLLDLINPNGRVPVLETASGDFLPESNAIQQKRKLGCAAFGVMERHLADREFFVGERYSIADIALYAYTHVADEGGFALDTYPAVREWFEKCAAQPAHIPITAV